MIRTIPAFVQSLGHRPDRDTQGPAASQALDLAAQARQMADKTACAMPTHTETKRLPYTAQQMYDLVADVGSYPKFLPWNAAARIRTRRPIPNGGEVMEADLVISFKVFRERFTSRVTLWPEALKIDTEYLDGPFRHMRSNWAFRDIPGGCEVDFFVDFEFRNAILQGIIGVVFNDAMLRIVRAFERRAAELYGPAPL